MLVFSQKSINLNSKKEDWTLPAKAEDEYVTFKVWSIELGIIELHLKEEQSLLKGIVRKLTKNQRYMPPSHVIIQKRPKGIAASMTHTITVFRLTEDQEFEIDHGYLFDALVKMQNGITASMEKNFHVENR